MKASILSTYYRDAGEFTTKEESRYALRSVRIEPHPEQGVVVVATDGHTMCVFHDRGGSVEGDGITLRFRDALAELCGRLTLQVNDDGSASLCKGAERVETVRFADMVEAKAFPTWRSVLSSLEVQGQRADYNPEYLMRCSKTGDTSWPNIAIWSGSDGSQVTHGDDKPAVVCSRERDDAFFLVMPMRQTGEVKYPEDLLNALRPKALSDVATTEETPS